MLSDHQTAQMTHDGRGHDTSANRPPAPPASQLHTACARRSVAPVAIFDENEDARRHLHGMLSLLGFDVIEFATPAALFAALPAASPACVILDTCFESTSGREVQRQLHMLNPAIPLIFVTACADVRTAVKAVKAGAIDYLLKPASPDELMNALYVALASGEHRREDNGTRDRLRDSEA